MPNANAPIDLSAAVRALAEPIAREHGAFVVACEVRGHKGSRVVTLLVDTDDGIAIDDVERISRELGFVLDEEETIPGKYTLDVGSPGATRPLELPRQYYRHVGRTLAVRYRAADGAQKAEGELVVVGESRFTLQPDGGADALDVAFDDVIEAKVKLPW
jgi:ribosome maturation factor RimP